MGVRHYRLVLKTTGLVHIGGGATFGAKDYFPDGSKIAVLDVEKFVSLLDKHTCEEYCKFLAKTGSREGLNEFLGRFPDAKAAAKSAIAYKVDFSLARTRRGSYQYFDVAEFVKDPYGCPYVPGSSVKGMMRTALLTYVVSKDSSYQGLFDRSAIRGSGKGARHADKQIVNKALRKDLSNDAEAEPLDIMRFISVSDSLPLEPSALTFAKKYDKFSEADNGFHKKALGHLSDARYYEGNELNIYRECLKPSTVVELSLDIDSRIDKFLDGLVLDDVGVMEAFQVSFDLYNESFLAHFDVEDSSSVNDDVFSDGRCAYIFSAGPFSGTRCRNSVQDGSKYCRQHQKEGGSQSDETNRGAVACYLGGGSDFNTKTIVQALFPDHHDRVNEIARILFSQFPTRIDRSRHSALEREVKEAGFLPKRFEARYRRDGRVSKAKEDHRHWCDVQFGVSPHSMKYGIVGKERFPMGKCELRIEKR